MKLHFVNPAQYNFNNIEFEKFCKTVVVPDVLPVFFTQYNMSTTNYLFILYKEHLFKSYLHTISNCKVLYFNAIEPITDFSLQFLSEITDILDKNNIKIEMWLGNWDTDYINQLNLIHKNIKCINWNKLIMYLSYNIYKTATVDQKSFSKLFLNLNNKQRYHRCCLIDELSKYNLLSDGHVSWLKTNDSDTSSYYNFKYFDNQKRVIDTDQILSNHPIITNKIYEDSFINVFGEYTEFEKNVIDISEKTWTSILYQKVFLAVAAKGYYKRLSELGFKLYDEIFNYDFDLLDSVEDRTQGVVKNLLAAKHLDYDKEYLNLKDKIMYNKQHLLKMLNEHDELLNQWYSYPVQDTETNVIVSKFKYHKTKGLVE